MQGGYAQGGYAQGGYGQPGPYNQEAQDNAQGADNAPHGWSAQNQSYSAPNDPYGQGGYAPQAPAGPVDYGQEVPMGRGPADYYQEDADAAGYTQDGRYQRNRSADGSAYGGPDQDTQVQPNVYGQPSGYDQDGWFQAGSYREDQQSQDGRDTQYLGNGYGQDDRYQGGPAVYSQGPAEGKQPGDDGPRGPRRRSGGRGRADKPRRPRLLRRLLSHRSVQAILIVLVIFFGWVGWSVGQALTVPGNGTVSTRLAEWARDHYLGPVVTLGEWLTYKAPKVGGKPQFSLTAPKSSSGTSRTGTSTFQPIVPATLTSPAGAPLPGEGQWRLLASVNGYPAIYGTYLRPDSVHTSYVAGIASMDQRLLTFQLRPGAEDPGGSGWGYSPYLPAGSRNGLLATFNGGFKLDSAGGGFYLNGHTKGVLTNGAASLVYYRNGTVAIGSWDQTVSMNANVLGVRQNLKLIVSNGAVPSTVDQNVQGQWGATLGGGYYVWRSGIGITRDGRVVWVYGPALSVRTLADLLQRAGAVEAMQMDINPAWMSYMYYKPAPSAANPTPVNLLPNQPEPANRYYSINSRDFTAVFAR